MMISIRDMNVRMYLMKLPSAFDCAMQVVHRDWTTESIVTPYIPQIMTG
jgi:hypothetical protein